jgi:hypothetical protein
MNKKEYELTDEQLKNLLEAFRSVPVIKIGDCDLGSQQGNANSAWEKLGAELGFKPFTAEPISGKGNHFFMAEPASSPMFCGECAGIAVMLFDGCCRGCRDRKQAEKDNFNAAKLAFEKLTIEQRDLLTNDRS